MVIKSYKERLGFGRWVTILVYLCQGCKKEMKIVKNWSGGAPAGAFECFYCKKNIPFKE